MPSPRPRLPPGLDCQLVALYARLQHLQWSLLSRQKQFTQLLEQQRRRLEEQDKIILHLTRRLASTGPPTAPVEELVDLALARVPKVTSWGAATPEKGDSDSAIHLDSSYDSLRSSPPKVSRLLQRSVSDVVVLGGGAGSPFSTPLYRGFLLRHQRRPKAHSPELLSHLERRTACSPELLHQHHSQEDCSPPPGPGSPPCRPVSLAIRTTGSQRSGQTPRMVKARCRRQKTTILISPGGQ